MSALKKENIDRLKEVIVKFLPEGHVFYDEDAYRQAGEIFCSRMLREKFFHFTMMISYGVMVSIQEFAERSDKLVYINAEIIVERESQKAVIIGKGGESLKKTGAYARKSLSTSWKKYFWICESRERMEKQQELCRDSMIRNNPS
ncbi:MAG: KH domain-containing protein [Ignavibacteria bacterium]|nr:KH domain-containing protein [Ignavibacteria bacterium]